MICERCWQSAARHGYTTAVNGERMILRLDPRTGATVLTSVCEHHDKDQDQ